MSGINVGLSNGTIEVRASQTSVTSQSSAHQYERLSDAELVSLVRNNPSNFRDPKNNRITPEHLFDMARTHERRGVSKEDSELASEILKRPFVMGELIPPRHPVFSDFESRLQEAKDIR